MKRLVLAVTAATLLSGATAFAADMPVKAPVYKSAAPMYNWTGFYGGFNVGGYWGSNDFDSGGVGGSIDPTGYLGGLQIGYNWQYAPNWVVGIELDSDFFGDVSKNTTFGANNLKAEPARTGFGSLRARFGYAANDTLWFLTGGIANYEQRITSSVAGASTSERDLLSGWVVGAGIEKAIAPNWTAKIEYLYSDMSRAFYTLPNLPAGSLTVNDMKMSTVRIGLNYRFDWGKGPVVARY